MPSITLEVPSAGQKILAGLHATNYADLQALLNGGLDAINLANGAVTGPKLSLPYSNYTPVLTGITSGGGIGNGTIDGRYVQIGKLVHCYGSLEFGTTTSLGVGTAQISLPIAAAASLLNVPLGGVRLFDTSTSNYRQGQAFYVAGPNFVVQYDSTHGGPLAAVDGSASQPWLWANGDRIAWNFTYEAV